MRKGFTLIELLVVIAIIAILAAMLFPVFLKVRENAFASKCLAHGRQLGMAMMMYLDDNNGRFPSAATQEMLDAFADWKWDATVAGHPWTGVGVNQLNAFKFIQLKKYVKNLDIWICPSPSGPYGQKYAYVYKCSWFFFGGPLVKNAADYPDTGFTKPDSTGRAIGRILTEVLGEDRANYGRPGVASKKVFACCYSLGPDILVELYPGGPVATPYFPHGEGSIYVYMDGHAKWRETGCGWAPVGYTNHRMDRPHKHGIGL